MKYCSKCGFENTNYAKFCVKCGNSFVAMDIDTIKKHNLVKDSHYSKETNEISQKQDVNKEFNESHFKYNKFISKFKLFYIFDERKNKYRISKLKVILAIETAFLFAFSVYVSLFVEPKFFVSEFAVNPVVAIILLVFVSLIIAGLFVIPTGIIGWILRKVYLYLTR